MKLTKAHVHQAFITNLNLFVITPFPYSEDSTGLIIAELLSPILIMGKKKMPVSGFSHGYHG